MDVSFSVNSNINNPVNYFDQLSNEILAFVWSFLEPSDAISVLDTCKRFNNFEIINFNLKNDVDSTKATIICAFRAHNRAAVILKVLKDPRMNPELVSKEAIFFANAKDDSEVIKEMIINYGDHMDTDAIHSCLRSAIIKGHVSIVTEMHKHLSLDKLSKSVRKEYIDGDQEVIVEFLNQLLTSGSDLEQLLQAMNKKKEYITLLHRNLRTPEDMQFLSDVIIKIALEKKYKYVVDFLLPISGWDSHKLNLCIQETRKKNEPEKAILILNSSFPYLCYEGSKEIFKNLLHDPMLDVSSKIMGLVIVSESDVERFETILEYLKVKPSAGEDFSDRLVSRAKEGDLPNLLREIFTHIEMDDLVRESFIKKMEIMDTGP